MRKLTLSEAQLNLTFFVSFLKQNSRCLAIAILVNAATNCRAWSSGAGRDIPPCCHGLDVRRQHLVLVLGVPGCGGVHWMLTTGIICLKGPHAVACIWISPVWVRPLGVCSCARKSASHSNGPAWEVNIIWSLEHKTDFEGLSECVNQGSGTQQDWEDQKSGDQQQRW